MRRLIVALVLSSCVWMSCGREKVQECVGDGAITPICGFVHPEDLEVLPGGRHLLVSEYGGPMGERATTLRLLDLATHEHHALYPKGAAAAPAGEAWGDPACPGPPDEIGPHGIHLGDGPGGRALVLAVNHREREAVEFFELEDAAGESPELIWRGCVVAPERTWMNDVVVLPGGGFVVSHMIDRGATEEAILSAEVDAEPTGYALQWQPDAGWSRVKGSEGALTNGLEVSPEGTVLYANYYFGNRVRAIELASGETLWETEVPSPDNSSWSPDGRLLVASHRADLKAVGDCQRGDNAVCELPYAVVALDTNDGSATTLFEGGGAIFGGATVAVQVDDRFYMGSFAGERMARRD